MQIKYIGNKPELTLTMPWLQEGPYRFNEENEYMAEVNNKTDSAYLLSMRQTYREVAAKSSIAKVVASEIAITKAQIEAKQPKEEKAEETFTCEVCGYEAKTKAGLIAHSRKHAVSEGNPTIA